MKMKPKPNFTADEFMEAAAQSEKPALTMPARRERKPKAASRERPPSPPPPAAIAAAAPPELRKNVVMALVQRDIEALKDRAYAETKKMGRRVTQQAIVDAALRAYLYR